MSKMSDLDILIDETLTLIEESEDREARWQAIQNLVKEVLGLVQTHEANDLVTIDRLIDEFVDAMLDSPDDRGRLEQLGSELAFAVQDELVRRYSDRIAEKIRKRLRESMFNKSTIN